MDYESECLGLNVPTGEERRRRSREARKKQVELYQAWERDLANAGSHVSGGASGESRSEVSGRKKRVGFHATDRLRDAVTRCDKGEGRHKNIRDGYRTMFM